MDQSIKRIGIMAGGGSLPVIFARHARSKGMRVIALALKDAASRELESAAHRTYWLTPGDTKRIPLIFMWERIRNVVLCGKIPKEIIFKHDFPDNSEISSLLKDTKDRMDETILKQAEVILKKFGVRLMNTTEFLPELLAERKVYTEREPTQAERGDIEFGLEIARAVGRLDIGQTVVVKDKAVISVEAIEGTDETIRRCRQLGIDGLVVVKASKPGQDLRYDVPTVGLKTIESLIEARAKVMAIEAGKAFFIEREESIREADKHGICIIGI